MREYIILSGSDAGTLEEQVDEYLEGGWEILGGVEVVALPATSKQETGLMFYQAMSRHAK